MTSFSLVLAAALLASPPAGRVVAQDVPSAKPPCELGAKLDVQVTDLERTPVVHRRADPLLHEVQRIRIAGLDGACSIDVAEYSWNSQAFRTRDGLFGRSPQQGDQQIELVASLSKPGDPHRYTYGLQEEPGCAADMSNVIDSGVITGGPPICIALIRAADRTQLRLVSGRSPAGLAGAVGIDLEPGR